MSYAQAMRHRPHKLHMGHTFNPSGIQYAAPRQPEDRVRCPGCAKKYARSTVAWVLDLGRDADDVLIPCSAMCKRCHVKRLFV